MPRTYKPVRVKPCTVGGRKAFGLTDGKKWFFYAYETRAAATSMLRHFTEPKVVEVNISQPQPFKMADDANE
jgi:hypothetical protein